MYQGNADPPGGLVGVGAGTSIETETGWRRVGTLRPGEWVHTLGGGLRQVRGMRRIRAPGGVRIPGGALGNCAALDVLPGTQILVAGPAVAAMTGDTAVFLRAGDLAGRGGCRRRADGWYHLPDLGDEEVVYVNSALRLRCPCPGAQRIFPVLDGHAAGPLLSCLFDPAPARRGLAQTETV